MVTDTKALSDLKEELYQLCNDIDLLIADIADETKAQEVSNSLDEVIEAAGECVVMLQGEEPEEDDNPELTDALEKATGTEDEEPAGEEIPAELIEAHDAMHEDMGEYEGDHSHVGIEDGVHEQMHAAE